MPTTIICPNCKTEFEPEAALAQSITDHLKKEYNQRWTDLEKQKDEQFRQKELQWQQQQQELLRKTEEDKKAMEAQLHADLQKKVGAEYENKLKILEDTNKNNEAKLTEAREKELEFLKKMQELKTKELELELNVQRKLTEERNKLSEIIKKEEEEKNKLRDAEYEMKLKEREKTTG